MRVQLLDGLHFNSTIKSELKVKLERIFIGSFFIRIVGIMRYKIFFIIYIVKGC